MNTFARIPIAVILVILAWLGLQALASESGEVVSLTTHDHQGRTRVTRLWVVEYEGAEWLRAGSPGSTWFERLKENPKIELKRKSHTLFYHAVPVPSMRSTINQLMREKYGWRDRYVSFFYSRDDAMPIRLEKVGITAHSAG